MSELKVGLTAEEKKLYSQLFRSLDSEKSGIITGDKARTTFEKSGLPPAILGEIWQLADQQNLGFLNQLGFCYAMRLIGYTQAGHQPAPGLADYPGPLPKFINLGLPPPNVLQPQSTNSSFMQSPSAILSPPPPASSLSNDYVEPVKPNDLNNFSQLFIKTVGNPQGELNGNEARNIFLKTKLPSNILEQIWYLVDINKSGKLNIGSFVIAMHLIQGLLSGSIKQLPPSLSDEVWNSVSPTLGVSPQQGGSRQISQGSISSQQTTLRHNSGTVPSQSQSQSQSQSPRSPSLTNVPNNEWIITPVMKQQYDSIFDNIDKQKVGHLNPEQVAGFLMTSKLNQQDLATVWDLSDIQNTGIFTKVEFAIALFLVNKKLAGGKLPNIVPHTLIESLQQPQQPQPVIEETRAPAVQPIAKQKTAMDDLVDIFGSSSNASPVPAQASIPAQASVAAISPLEQRVTSSSDLTPPAELPKVRAALTGAFKPTSTFGQSLINKQQDVQTHDNLLGDDVHHQSPTKEVVPPPITSDTPPVTSPTKQINYEALRSVPPPPPPSSKKVSSPPTTTTSTTATSSIPGSFPTGGSFQSNYQSPAPPVSESNTYSQNEDLLADTNPEISGQLSQANADIANVSNQIRSLATQTTNLHEKKIRAEQELQRILNTKVEIENKLKQLRSSYDNEVLQVNQVEKNLSNAKEETEALRSQASISEAKFNALSSDLNTKQLAVEELQKQNGSLKEKLGYLNAEIAELEKNVTQKVNEHQNLSNQVAIKKSQVQVAIVKSEELKNQIKSVEESHLKLQSELDEAHIKSQTFEQEHSQLNEQLQTTINQKPTQPSPHVLSKSVVGGVAAGSIIGGVAAAVGHVVSSDHTQEEPQSQAQKEVAQDDDKDLSEINEEDINSKFPDISGTTDGGIDNVTNATSSIVTDDKANDDENETPITSPSNSDFQFPQGSNAAGVVGGLVGMPGVLVGVQRTDSLTSSVQNNAALSVRDDNIEEISDRDTIDNSNLGGDDEDAIPESISTENYGEQEEEEEHENKDITHHNQEDNSDGDKLSSGVESFEIVNGDEARANEAQAQAQAQAHAESQTETEYPAPNLTDETERPSEEGTSRELGAGEEFPPIKELDYEESDSSSETASQDDNFDDAVAELSPSANPPGYEESIGAIPPVSQPPKEVITPGTTTATTTTTTTGPAPTFDDFFNDLQPATQEQAAPNDLFGDDEFSNLEAARDDNVGDEFETKDYGFSDEFTNTTPAANFNSTSTNGNENENTGTGNDEWEQLFAGFGNAAPVESTTSESTTTNNIHAATPIRVSSTNDVAIQELVGMGFSESSALEALQKSNWNLEDATNYLLDSA